MNAPDKIYLEKSLSFPDRFHSQWSTWEKACEDGVKYCLENLI